MVVFFSVAVPAFGVACAITYLLARPGSPLQILDQPTARSLHSMPMPRTGGLAIWAGSLAGMVVAYVLFGARPEFAWIAGAALVVGVVSFVDDRSYVPIAVRLATHLGAGGLLLLGGLGLQTIRLPGIELNLAVGVGAALSLLFVVWMVNLYNFMDGMDGFAAGMAVFGFGTLGLLGYMAGDGYFAALCWAVAAAAGGFLVFNFPPARIFMGDTGASVLGLSAAAFALWGDRMSLFPLWIAILLFSPFIVDATVTLIKRAMRSERVWEAHRSHYYQRLVQLGWGHRKTVLIEYILMGGCAITAVVLLEASPTMQWLGAGAWGIIYALVFFAVDRVGARNRAR